jgi:trimethylamine:corrinoid methyltransferase-like protein
MRILSEIGMRFHHAAALGLFQDHGFKVEKGVVRFDPDLLMVTVAKAPSRFRLYAAKKTMMWLSAGRTPNLLHATVHRSLSALKVTTAMEPWRIT